MKDTIRKIMVKNSSEKFLITTRKIKAHMVKRIETNSQKINAMSLLIFKIMETNENDVFGQPKYERILQHKGEERVISSSSRSYFFCKEEIYTAKNISTSEKIYLDSLIKFI